MSEIIEMFWGCLSCQAPRNRGRFKECERCGAPRTPDSPEYMPDDIQVAPTVEEPELLRKFEAGVDWKCRYCGSSAFRADGCCAQCGSPQGESTVRESTSTEPSSISTEEPPVARRRIPDWVIRIVAVVFFLSLAGWLIFRERTYDVTVQSVSWTSTVHLERYSVHSHESFLEGVSAGAFDRVPLGLRHHHDEKLLDHYDTVPYSVSELAGYRSESYSASEACGQSCYTTPRSCTSNRNGSATCTGGGEHCSTKYCSVSRTRQVPYYHDVTHYRQEPRYRYEPRFAVWYSWRAWEWAPDHDVRRSGTDTKITWPPSKELLLNLSSGEQQREGRETSMQVIFSGDDKTFDYVPKSQREFGLLAPHSRHRIKSNALGSVTPLDLPKGI